ncbi:hypothetical protein GBF38_012099 [Xyrichtys novacula]|uniref:G-protein coupled receptors family 1 profile domain-containing protein n=1 Tax=Xyrichtys novacula TaxID=13765 RepID=A0AAV1FVD2_XYRNO|nr:hypothetical protein GBF38_012099 [Xyrichtys novacula]
MTLERYVAICMPLRHEELCSMRRTLCCIFIIQGLSTVPCLALLFAILSSTPLSFYFQYKVCNMPKITVHYWQQHFHSAVYQFYFLIMSVIIVFCYVKIMKVAKVVSGDNKESTQKGLRTVILHAFQLLLCLMQLWFPLIEANTHIPDLLVLGKIVVVIFLSINIFLIVTFFQRECFNTTARYILFAVTLHSDSLILIISDILLVLLYLKVTLPIWVCMIILSMILLWVVVTPVTLTAMVLERYVAICMPLRHEELCSMRRTLCCIFIIQGLSTVPCLVVLFVIFSSTPVSFYYEYNICVLPKITVHYWQQHVHSAVYQFYFLIMSVIIVFCYVKIMKVAKVASGDNKESTQKGLRTVILHAFQLLLCLMQLWIPLIEANLHIPDTVVLGNLRIFTFVFFILAPRCLSPLIYGLRDEAFFRALKFNLFCGLYKESPAF